MSASVDTMLYQPMLDYLSSLEGTQTYVDALERLDRANCQPPPVEDPPFPYMQETDWAALASPRSRPLVSRIATVIDDLPWHVPYNRAPIAGPGFEKCAMATGQIGPISPIRSDVFASGFFVIGPNIDYFDHRHRPEELYLPIAGSADFWNEERGWYPTGPDDVTIHPPWQWHALRTGEQPIMIFWAWLAQDVFGDPIALRECLGGLPYQADRA